MEKKQLKVSESEYAKNLVERLLQQQLIQQEHGKLTLMKTTRHWKL